MIDLLTPGANLDWCMGEAPQECFFFKSMLKVAPGYIHNREWNQLLTSTATLWFFCVSIVPSASMRVDLPEPGEPEKPSLWNNTIQYVATLDR